MDCSNITGPNSASKTVPLTSLHFQFHADRPDVGCEGLERGYQQTIPGSTPCVKSGVMAADEVEIQQFKAKLQRRLNFITHNVDEWVAVHVTVI